MIVDIMTEAGAPRDSGGCGRPGGGRSGNSGGGGGGEVEDMRLEVIVEDTNSGEPRIEDRRYLEDKGYNGCREACQLE